MAELYGIDISEFQGLIDWPALNAVTNFVIIRASFGTMRQDNQFARNQEQARAIRASAPPLGIGYYYYGYPTLVDPVTSANYFVDNLGPLQEDEVLALDLEGNIGTTPVAWSLGFLNQVKARTGVNAWIYLNQSERTGFNWQPVVDGGYGLWEAEYSGDRTTEPDPSPWPVMAGRQWSSTDAIAGVNALVDGDTFYGDLDQFNAYGFHTAQPAPPAPVQPAPSVEPPVPAPTPVPIPVVTSTAPPVASKPVDSVIPPSSPSVSPSTNLPTTIGVNTVSNNDVIQNKFNIHNILASVSYFITVAGAVIGYFNSTQTAALLSVITAALAAVQHARITKSQ